MLEKLKPYKKAIVFNAFALSLLYIFTANDTFFGEYTRTIVLVVGILGLAAFLGVEDEYIERTGNNYIPTIGAQSQIPPPSQKPKIDIEQKVKRTIERADDIFQKEEDVVFKE